MEQFLSFQGINRIIRFPQNHNKKYFKDIQFWQGALIVLRASVFQEDVIKLAWLSLVASKSYNIQNIRQCNMQFSTYRERIVVGFDCEIQRIF